MMPCVSEKLVKGYRFVAEHDAPSRSPLYAELAAGVAEDAELIAWLDGLPDGKRQPNLLFASYRLVAGTPSGWPEFHAILHERRDEIEGVMLERRTQTNEATRCALMLPLLAQLPQPLALLEVGASAGLCLLPDRYGYDYDGHTLGAGPPVLKTHVENDPPLPQQLPEIAWRAGLDLNPIDVTDDDQIRWLELLDLARDGVPAGHPARGGRCRPAGPAAARPGRPDDQRPGRPRRRGAEGRDAGDLPHRGAVLRAPPSAARSARRSSALGATWLACEGANVLGFGKDSRRTWRWPKRRAGGLGGRPRPRAHLGLSSPARRSISRPSCQSPSGPRS